MNSNFQRDRRVFARRESTAARQRALILIATACILAPAMVGCHVSQHEQVVAEPHYANLDQACFGYEPTVWRTMTDDCVQAVRLIPDEVVQVRESTQAEGEPAMVPDESMPPDSALEDVPDPAMDDPGTLPGIVRPPADATTPLEVPDAGADEEPRAMPAEPEVPDSKPALPKKKASESSTLDQPTPRSKVDSTPVDPPSEEPEAKTPPKTPPATEPAKKDPGVSTSGTSRFAPQMAATATPVRQASNLAATELFRTVRQALHTSSATDSMARQRPARKPAAGLSRFISY